MDIYTQCLLKFAYALYKKGIIDSSIFALSSRPWVLPMATLFYDIKIKKKIEKKNYIIMTIIKENKVLKINIKLKFSLDVKLQPTFRVQNALLCTK